MLAATRRRRGVADTLWAEGVHKLRTKEGRSGGSEVWHGGDNFVAYVECDSTERMSPWTTLTAGAWMGRPCERIRRQGSVATMWIDANEIIHVMMRPRQKMLMNL